MRYQTDWIKSSYYIKGKEEEYNQRELDQYIGHWFGVQNQFAAEPMLGKLEKSDLPGYWYRFIPQPLSVSIPADCPKPELEGYETEHVGRSGIGSRNRWRVYLEPVEEKELPVLVERGISVFQPEWWINYHLEFKKVPLPNLEEREKVKELLRQHRARYFEEQRKKETEVHLRNWDAAVVREFNKAPFFGKAPEGYLVSFVKETSCGNTTVILMRDQEEVKVPNEIKGLVIGKKGRRIKALEERAGHRIRIV